MRTLDDQNTRSFALRARMIRDIRLLRRIATMVLAYFTTGARIRKQYREKERSRETYWLD
jgi:hypothetical protein